MVRSTRIPVTECQLVPIAKVQALKAVSGFMGTATMQLFPNYIEDLIRHVGNHSGSEYSWVTMGADIFKQMV